MARKKLAGSRREVVAFLDAIKDDPDDDTPRLVLADWLDEHGDEHDAARALLAAGKCRRAPAPGLQVDAASSRVSFAAGSSLHPLAFCPDHNGEKSPLPRASALAR